MEEALQELLDRRAIQEALLRYCRGVDRSDAELVRSAYHADAYDDHGTTKGNAWEFAERVTQSMRVSGAITMHTLGNISIELDGDRAHVESYVVAYHRQNRNGEPSDFVFGGRYVDRFEQRQGEWKIAHRVVVHEWSRVDAVGERWPAESAFAQGSRSRDDPSYRR